MAQGAPKKGGTLRMGLEGGSASDSLDPLTDADSIPIGMSLMLWNNLVEVADNGDATGELFESWTAKPGAADWTGVVDIPQATAEKLAKASKGLTAALKGGAQ